MDVIVVAMRRGAALRLLTRRVNFVNAKKNPILGLTLSSSEWYHPLFFSLASCCYS
jgi:hypothetical protein